MPTDTVPSPRPIAIAWAGLLALAIAMGIGRFAYTPLLPMMLHDGVIGLGDASWLATANYLGYWLGAIGCALQPSLWRRWGRAPLAHTRAIRVGLVATVLLTLGMALPCPAAWALWRFLAGVASAVVFVYVSGWCLMRLGVLGAPALAGIIYVGPGLGIAVSGFAATAMVALGVRAATGWAVFGVLALALTALAWPRLRGVVTAPPRRAADAHHPPFRAVAAFTLAYGLAGFGYIITATFLPVIARQALPGSVWLDLFWPIFGIGVAMGALLTVRLPMRWDRRHLLMACYGMQATGVLLTVWWPTLTGFALGSLLLGVPFTAITLFAMQEARRLRPHNASALIGLLTAAYGLGQIAGPPLVAWLLRRSTSPSEGFAWSLETAAAALLLGLAIYALLARKPSRLIDAECAGQEKSTQPGS
ncbi:YbfB/YjiJ family MFS transporter [Ottowia testudinis]|uniref:YbfB/YjiJ family MFS transporter n=1 Tax=Ottowia testudinis TaxID=2816950 RepID=A0A975H2Y0_9BURK|nr:YbfB/YjiJ family MFS transporter [Ottowia testudinis]QTD44671.1 YbfB/YjiJ family MFS transporter [Ottowia testudinis]